MPSLSPQPPSPVVEIQYYTDPLCAWSWAFEPQWRRLRYEYAGQIAWCYRMGGMIPDWKQFRDPMNAIHSPGQMGPLWMQARLVSGMPFNERIWHDDPPASSYPPSLAFKAVELQGPVAAERYFRRLREAAIVEGVNVSRPDLLISMTEDWSSTEEGQCLDFERFQRDIEGQEAAAAFQEDLKDARFREIGRFPSLIVKRVDGPAVLIVGYRPYSVLVEALRRVAPDLCPTHAEIEPEDYAEFWGRLTDREMQEATAASIPDSIPA